MKVTGSQRDRKMLVAGWGWVGVGGQMGKNKKTIQCSKHLLSTYWVLKSRVQGGHSESLRSDWLTGKRRGEKKR